jgi:hypothetical protein
MNVKLLIAGILVAAIGMVAVWMCGAPPWAVVAVGFIAQNQVIWSGIR